MLKSFATLNSRLGATLIILSLLIALGIAAGAARPVYAADGTFKFSAGSFSGAEGDNAILTVTRTGGLDAVNVHYTVAQGSAELTDYFSVSSGQVSFAQNELTHNITLATAQDADTADDTFTVTLDNTTGGTIGSPAAAGYTILDDDGPPSFAVTDLTVLESVGTAIVTVTRSGNLNPGQTVTFFTSTSGSATPGVDYTEVGDTVLTFGDGVSTKTVNVSITNDGADESDETLNLNLKDPSDSGSVAGTPWTLTIQDDENGVIEFTSATYSVTEDATTKQVALKRTGGTLLAVSVTCKTVVSGSTASAGSDYTTTSTVVNFGAGVTTANCPIPILEDVSIEGNETVNLSIGVPIVNGAIIGAQSTAVLTIIDEDGTSTLQFNASNFNVIEGVATVTITVTRSGTTNLVATAVYTTSTGTAGAPGDYTHTTGTVTFNAGVTSRTFTVPITNDGVLEVTEKFNLTLTSPTNASLGSQNTATVTIADNDGLAPVVTSVTPDNGLVAGGTLVVVLGANFTGTTSVKFGATEATTFTVDNDGKITATSPAHVIGPVGVIVTNTSGISNVNITYTFTDGAPVVTSVVPNSGPIAGGTSVVISGLRFTGVTSVTFGGSAAAFTINSDTKITATAPAHSAGTFDVVVTNPAGANTNTASDNYTYTASTTFTYTLFFRWSLIVWTGANNADVQNALKGIENPDNVLTTNIFNQVTAVFLWDNVFQTWLAYFPLADEQNIPGANDFTTLKNGFAYWVAITGPSQIQWTIIAN